MNDLLVDRLKAARAESGLKQQEVAEKLGIKANTISNWEKGRTEPDIDSFVKLCDIYKIDCASLLSDVYAFKRIGMDISLTEYSHIKKYRNLDDHGKDMVDTVLDKEYNRVETEKKITPLPQPNKSYLEPVAARERTDIEVTDEMRKHDDAIMDDPNF